MKQKITFTLHEYNPIQQDILNLVGDFNKGIATFEFKDLISYLKVQKTKYALTYHNFGMIVLEGVTVHLSSNNGTTYHTTLELKELNELDEIKELGSFSVDENGIINNSNPQ
jgi:hypothetical protein